MRMYKGPTGNRAESLSLHDVRSERGTWMCPRLSAMALRMSENLLICAPVSRRESQHVPDNPSTPIVIITIDRFVIHCRHIEHPGLCKNQSERYDGISRSQVMRLHVKEIACRFNHRQDH